MAFDFHEWIMTGLRGAVGHEPDYRIIMNSTAWLERGVLEEADLAELQSLMTARNEPQDYEEKQDMEELEV